MHILLTNDDGIGASGLGMLCDALGDHAELTVVAPETARNGAGRSFTLDRPVRCREVAPGRFAVDGTPVDCVYIALNSLLLQRPPHLVISGINQGSNLAQDVTYSGTVGAAMEAADQGLPAAAVSLPKEACLADQRCSASFVSRIVLPLLLSGHLPAGTFLNVNLPCAVASCDGDAPWRFTRLGRLRYGPAVLPVENPRGRPFFWLGGKPLGFEPIPGSDCVALDEGVVSITPLGLDLTDLHLLAELQAWHRSQETDRSRAPIPPAGAD
jgi:5'-nucleotidase